MPEIGYRFGPQRKDAGQHALTASWTHYGEGFSMVTLGPVWAVASMHSEVGGLHCGCFHTVSVGLASDIHKERLSHQTHSSVFKLTYR